MKTATATANTRRIATAVTRRSPSTVIRPAPRKGPGQGHFGRQTMHVVLPPDPHEGLDRELQAMFRG